ncbi:tetratricopeptide repeat protein [Rhodoflexus caldus]|uniref:tetratricopeptide repeat protein n=1 Tax=Rhodoflexus caldus TaxID=2891236 RepID=UPI002029D956|nr:tetratricopeptide repeat protein [Rhodoflexus caldus]
MNRIGVILFAVLCCLAITGNDAYARQAAEADSLERSLQNPQPDTVRIRALNRLAFLLRNSQIEKARTYAEAAYKLAQSASYKLGMAESLGFLGLIYYRLGMHDQAIDRHLQSLKLFEELKDNRQIAFRYNDIANIYVTQGYYDRALEYHNKSLILKQKINDREGVATSLKNIANMYLAQKKYTESLEYCLKALPIADSLGDQRLRGHILQFLGEIYLAQRDYKRAIDYLQTSYNIKAAINEQFTLSRLLNSIGNAYLNQNDIPRALKYYQDALTLAKKTGVKLEEQISYGNISNAYRLLNDYKKAYDYHVLFMNMKDSIFNETSREKITMLETRFQSEKKQAEIDRLNMESTLQQQEIAQQNQRFYFIVGLVAILAVFGVVMVRANNQRRLTNLLLQKQKQEIEIVYKELELKNNDITASINYAKRIQSAIIPSEERLRSFFPESFVMLKPRDIVSGDFYFLEKVVATDGREKIVLAAADCTGHGVPGALMSMVGNDLLSQIVNERQITHPDLILNQLHQNLRRVLKIEDSDSRDGMDIAICTFDMETRQLEYAGAMSPLYLARNGEITKVNPDKKPIGGRMAGYSGAFTRCTFDIEGETMLYLASDGYQDQFGGIHNKKFMSKNFRQLLQDIHMLPIYQQQQKVESVLAHWMSFGPQKQTDDILLIGVRLKG